MLVHEDRTRARGQSLDRNFGTFFAAIMVVSFAGIVLAMILSPANFTRETPLYQEPYPARLASQDSLVENFEKLVFTDSGRRYSIAWDHSPNASLYGKGSEALRPWVEEQFEIVNRATGMTVILKDTLVGPEDIYIQLVTRAAFQKEDALCFNRIEFKGVGQRIRKEYIIIPDDHASAILRSCVVHELMHAIGFKEHPTDDFDSVLSITRDIREFTVNDLILMRTLYDPAIRTSMTRDQIMALAPDIIRKVRLEFSQNDRPLGAYVFGIALSGRKNSKSEDLLKSRRSFDFKSIIKPNACPSGKGVTVSVCFPADHTLSGAPSSP